MDKDWKIVYAICEYCGHALTDIRFNNPRKRNATENFVICDKCVREGKGKPESDDDELVLVTCPAGRWPPSTPYWVRRKRIDT